MKRFSQFLPLAALTLAWIASPAVAQVSLNIGDVPNGQVVTITCEVTVNDPLPVGVFAITNQGTFTGNNFAARVTDDPDSFRLDDPTVTTVPAEVDLGDAPASYPVLLADDGARHVVPFNGATLFLGSNAPDVDSDGVPHASAAGDDLAGTADEDGVMLPGILDANTSANISIAASANGVLNAWIDFNRDGDWDDAGEQVATNFAASVGANQLTVSVPEIFAGGQSFARFRLSSDSDLSPRGLASDGEVEDYAVVLNASPILTGLIGAQPVNDNATITPFSSASITDQHAPEQTLTAVVVIDDSARGQLGNLGSFVEDPAGVYTLSGTQADLTTAVRALIYTPTVNRVAAGFTETASFRLTVNDGSITATNSITSVVATSINDAPVMTNQNFSINENSVAGVSVGTIVAVDPDPATTLDFSIASGNTGAAFALNAATGELTVSNAAALDFESFTNFVLTVQVNDDGPGTLSATATITIAVNDANDAPSDIALSSNTLNQSAGVNGIVGTLSSTDVDSASFAYTLVAGAGDTDNALFNISGASLRANDATAMNAGSYTVRVQTDDGSGGTFSKAFQIEVLDTTPPSISIGAPSVSATSSGPVAYLVTYTGADSVTLVEGDITLNTTGSAAGSLFISGSGVHARTVTITNISGSGSLSISIAAGTASDLATNLAASAGPSTAVLVNARPSVTVDVASLETGEGSTITNSGAFSDAEGNAGVTISASIGSVSSNVDGTWAWSFTPADGPDDSQLITISADDGVSTNSVTFNLTVTNLAPVALSQNVTNSEDVVLNLTLAANDAGNDSITNWVVAVQPTNGVLAGTFPNAIYTPATNFFGSDSFEFYAVDSDGAVSANASVAITILAVNDSPLAGADNVARANTARLSKVARASLLSNDSDAENDSLSIVAVGNALPLGATVELAGSFVAYTAPTATSGNGSFTYTLSDGVNLVTNLVTVTEISATPTASGPNSASIAANGSDYVLTFIGVPGRSYRVQFTGDAGAPYTWSEFNPLAIYTAPTNGVFIHTDVNPPNPMRLYRAVAHP